MFSNIAPLYTSSSLIRVMHNKSSSPSAEMSLKAVFLITLLTFFKMGSSQLAEIPDRGCVWLFRRSPEDFEICKTELCFVIINENPYMFLDPALAAAPSQPFFYRDHDILYSKLSGLFFDVLRGVSRRVPEVRESRCIYGGSKCICDDTVHFVGYVAKNDVISSWQADTCCL